MFIHGIPWPKATCNMTESINMEEVQDREGKKKGRKKSSELKIERGKRREKLWDLCRWKLRYRYGENGEAQWQHGQKRKEERETEEKDKE